MDSPGQNSEKSKPAFPHNQIVPSSISPGSPQESTSLSLSYIDEDGIPGLAQFDDVVTPLAATAARLGEITSTTSKSLKSAKSVSKSVPTAPSILPNSGTLLQRSRSGKRFLLSIFPLSILPVCQSVKLTGTMLNPTLNVGAQAKSQRYTNQPRFHYRGPRRSYGHAHAHARHADGDFFSNGGSP
ncbi:hypothetical protein DFP72DRAFT_905514 [Ephemerocybe angulata]|uniref:Uncharacterized protein n=1 Tax=Ephemerocybe angulata TaxID=980116 RepID=A0A8H6HTA7_9AGAR|nr:hypothetical protein DFP72DRAFT_905514 [Tulosesus angulatus]